MAIAADFFPAALEFTLAHEGGLSSDPRDPGGLTKWGISQRSYPDLNLRALTRDQAARLYLTDFWEALRCPDLPGPVAAALFDTAVNLGRRHAAMLLQIALNELAPGQTLRVDGVIGPVTVHVANAACGQSRCAALAVAQRILFGRLRRYAELARQAERRPFLRGWVRRVIDLADAITNQSRPGAGTGTRPGP